MAAGFRAILEDFSAVEQLVLFLVLFSTVVPYAAALLQYGVCGLWPSANALQFACPKGWWVAYIVGSLATIGLWSSFLVPWSSVPLAIYAAVVVVKNRALPRRPLLRSSILLAGYALWFFLNWADIGGIYTWLWD